MWLSLATLEPCPRRRHHSASIDHYLTTVFHLFQYGLCGSVKDRQTSLILTMKNRDSIKVFFNTSLGGVHRSYQKWAINEDMFMSRVSRGRQ